MAEKFDFRSLVIKGARVMVLVALFIIFSIFTQNFWGITNWANVGNLLFQEAPFYIMLGLGMTIPMIVGGLDLSIGSNISLSAVICAMLINNTQNLGIGILGCIGIGMGVGLINGLLIAKIGVPPFVATYSMDWIAKGAVLVISKGGQITGFNALRTLFNSWRGTYLVVSLVIIVIAWFLYSKTTFGCRTYSVGCNPSAAKLSGMSSDAITILAYVASGLIAAITAMMYMSRLGAAEPTLGNGLAMEAIAAALIGGASFTGARSKVVHALIGGLIIVVLNNGLIHIGVPGVWQDFAQGLIIIAAILMERGLEKLQQSGMKANG